MRDALSNYGNEFSLEEVIDMYIDRLTPAINSLVQQFHDAHEGCTYVEVVQQGKSDGDLLRTRTAPSSRASISKTTSVRQTQAQRMS